MKVSVVIPVYNEEKFIGKCLESLKKQIVPADEIIVIDNNCQDKTIAIAEKYKVRIVKEKTQGMIYARNCGFNAASYEVIARCDADAILPRDWIKKIKIHFNDPKLIALGGSFDFYDLFFKTKLFIKLYLKIMDILLNGKALMGPNMVLHKKIWEKIKNEVCLDDRKVHEDIDLSIHILKTGAKIMRDKSLEIKVSARRIKSNPLSFFVEYPIRLTKTLLKHR